MQTKLQKYTDFAEVQTSSVTGSREQWTNFLNTAGRLYKYPFEEQLMIHAQRPDATACAPLEMWNKPMNRYVRRGSKGIALIDTSSDKPRLRYVFDVSDTEDGWRNRADGLRPKRPHIWEMKPEHETSVVEALGAYGTGNVNENIGDMIYGLAHTLSARYYEDNKSDIVYATEGSFLEEYDEFNISVAYREALTVSAAYCMMKRMGIDASEYISDEDFQPIFDFNTADCANELGNGVSAISEEILREVEVAIKKYERTNTAERSNEHERYTHQNAAERQQEDGGLRANIQPERGLSDTRLDDSGNSTAPRQVRNDAQELFEGTPSDYTLQTDPERTIVFPLSGNRTDSERQTGIDDERPIETVTTTGQSDRPDGLDGAHEQPESTGGGSHFQRVNLQLDSEDSETPSLEGGVSASAAEITEDEINAYLSRGSHTSDSKYRVFSFFLHEHSAKEKAGFLKNEYGHGGGTYFFASGERGHYDATPSKGITLAKGGYLEPDAEIKLTWINVVNLIDNLINEGQYLSQKQLDYLPSYERKQLGAGVYNFFRSLPEDIQRPITISESADYWGEATRIGNTLDNPETLTSILDSMRPIMENTPSADRYYETRKTSFDNLTAFENGTFTLFPQPSAVQTTIETPLVVTTSTPEAPQEQPAQLSLFPTENEQIESIQAVLPLPTMVTATAITQDDIDTALRSWNGSLDSKMLVQQYMLENSRARQTADFLKEEYQEYGEKPPIFTVAKDGAEPITLPWAKVQRRIAQLMESGQFLTPEEQAYFEREYENAQELPAEITAPAYALGDTVYLEKDRQFIIEGLTDREVKLLDPSLYIPIARAMDIADFEREFARNPKNVSMIPTIKATKTDSLQPELAPNQHIETIDGAEFVFTGVLPVSRDIPEQIAETKPAAMPEPPKEKPENFRITDKHLGEGGAKTKYGYNVAALKLLKELEANGQSATPDEQEILSKYVGWGGLPGAFDPDNKQWGKEYIELNSLLLPEEYESARASTLNAHYTSPTVISAMYETLERLGVKGGNILEPACGAGNFLGLVPESMKNAKLYGVELDSVTGRIARQLYPNADIQIKGFEKTDTPDAFFDVAVGNVPFGSYKIADKRYDKHNFLIHDYFFAKTLDQVRPGGIVAFITSKGTLDKANPEVRKYLSQRAELLGAVRLPNTAFQKNAGTEVTSDIIFLQKRDRLMDIQPDWVHLGQAENDQSGADGISVNSYFLDNPHMMLGTMEYDDRMYGNNSETTCTPIEGADLAEQLKSALFNIQGKITEHEIDDLENKKDVSVSAEPNVRNFSYTVVDDTVYYRENSRMNPADMPDTTLERIKGMVKVRDIVHTLIDYQLYDFPDTAIHAKQIELSAAYEDFSKKFGLISSSANSKAFSADSAYYLLCSLEVIDENGNLERKSDMFTKRTIKQKTNITSVDTSAEALAVSISQKAKVDMPYMQELTGFTEEKITDDLHGVIFRDVSGSKPEDIPFAHYNLEWRPYVTADEYLSGNVREKLQLVERLAEARPDLGMPLAINISALKQAQPQDLDASEISVRLGATWVDKKYIQQFAYELFQTPHYLQGAIGINFAEHTAQWNVTGKSRVSYNDVLSTVTYGTSRMNAYRILEDTLNLKDVRVYDTQIVDGKESRVLNKKETTLAAQKQETIKQAFKDWVFTDPERRGDIVALYNERFNSTRVREYDGSHIEFSGISPEITLKQHQRDGIARILYGGNTLLAHEVGAGKTFEMVGAAMESKRLGLCSKSLVAVPNHLTEQMASEFLRLYPAANILVATKKDFETKNRKKFCAKIATGDYDCVIIGHSQLEKIPLSKERQERLVNEQIADIVIGIDELKRNNSERFTIKQLEKTKKTLEVRLEKLTDDSRKDDVVTFEQLGVDRLFVDESHNFKNLFLYTKMRNVAGLSTSEAQKSTDMFMKCRYMDEITGGKGIIFATGTPVTNSMSELYTIQRYLQYDELQKQGLGHFDAWASVFGETATSIELSPEGSGYRARTRFAKFANLPELMSMFKETADIRTADTLDLPRPKANFHTVVAKPTEVQKDMVKELSVRAKAVHEKKVEPTEDNMLKITSDGRKIGLDQRLMNPMLPDDETSKINLCMNNVFDIWEKSTANKGAQLLFCDFSTPNKNGRFNVYDDIKAKLIAKGIPEHEVAFIHDANTEVQKKELFAKVRKGQVRVLFGSTFKMGAGTNVQDRLIAMHDIDCPWRPADLAQRAGRIVRQGNMNPEVDIFRYCTEATFDSYLFQTVEKKQEFISQIMTSKSPVRSCDDVDEDSLSYAEIKALCAGNPLIKEKMNLDIEVAKLKLYKGEHQSQHYRLQDDLLTNFPKKIESSKGFIEGFKADIARLETNTHTTEESISPMLIGEKTYTDRGKAGVAILEACKNIKGTQADKIGTYRGFDMLLSFDSLNKEFSLAMKGAMTHTIVLGDDSYGNITRINNAFDKIPGRLQSVEVQLQTLYAQMESARAELQKPFPLEQELAEKTDRLAELDARLNMDESGEPEAEHENEPSNETVTTVKSELVAVSAKEKPSILEMLKVNAEKSRLAYGDKSETDKKAEVSI